MVLLDLLDALRRDSEGKLQLVVAHFDHGIRDDSKHDAQIVIKDAQRRGLPVEIGEAQLGANASEALARETRYNFLKIVKAKHNARAIITAHHQDDVLETAIINISRGTGRHGLSSLRSEPEILRPLLSFSKNDIVAYAKDKGVNWHEDSTNQDTTYLRNHIRQTIMPRLSDGERLRLLSIIESMHNLNHEIDTHLRDYVAYKSYRRNGRVFSRRWFNQLPHDFACHVMHHLLREMGARDYSRQFIERLVINIKVGKPGKVFDIDGKRKILLTKRSIRLLLN